MHVFPSRRFCVECGEAVPDVDDMGRPINRAWESFKSVIGFLGDIFLWPRGRW